MKKTILIADDEQIVVDIVALTLGSDDRFELLVARNGLDALDLARKRKPDVALLDVQMPSMNGFEVCRAIKGDPATADCIVFMLTAMAQQTDVKEGKSAGATHYIVKPFSPMELIDKVEAALEFQQRAGERVELPDGRTGSIVKRVSLTEAGLTGVAYHVKLDNGPTVVAREVTSLAG